MNDRNSLIETGLLIFLLIAGSIGCAVVQPTAGIICAASGLISLLLRAYFRAKRQNQISRICAEIGQILHGAEQINLKSFEEGELGLLSSEIRKMTVMLREQNAALRREQLFMKESLEDISHQLRTPLTSTILITQMLRRPDNDPKQTRENLQELVRLLTRMQWLIETLLGLSRLEADAVTFQHTEINCKRLIQESLEPISVAIELKGIEIQYNLNENAAFNGDMQYCTEALCNLFKNCMEHTPAGGMISVSADQNAIYTRILITDSGEGIATADLPHIFERFYRGGAFSKSGYGIGLAFARKIIAAQNGSIQVRNAKPHGAQFEIRFFHQSTV